MNISRQANQAAREIVKAVETDTGKTIKWDTVTEIMISVQKVLDQSIKLNVK